MKVKNVWNSVWANVSQQTLSVFSFGLDLACNEAHAEEYLTIL